MTKVKVKKAVEVPPSIQSVISKIINAPLGRIAEALKDFAWQYDKGDFHHWISLFNHFDTFFEEHLSKRADLTLNFSADLSDPPFPHENVLAILKTTTLILENCSNKHLYGSTEHLASLLAASHPETVTATLRTLVAFLRKTHHNNVRWHGNQLLNSRLLSLCRGWGGKEEGLDLTACASSDESSVKTVQPQCTTLHFEFFSDPAQSGSDGSQRGGVQKLHLPALEQYKESEQDILKELVVRYNVPDNHRFELLSRIRIAKNFASLQGRRHLVQMRLLAFYVVFQSHPIAEEVLSLFTSEPEFVTELVALVQQEETVPENLRTLALRCLAVQLLDRSRHSSVITAITAGGQSGLLAMLLHKSVASVVAQGARAAAGTATAVGPAAVDGASGAGATAAPATAAATAFATTSAAANGPIDGTIQSYSAQFVEALLSLVGALVASTSGCTALADAGIISALLPLLRDMHPDHVSLVASTVKILEAYMDFSQPASTVFRDLGGLTDMIDRLCVEVGVDPAAVAAAAAQPAPAVVAATSTDTAVTAQPAATAAGQPAAGHSTTPVAAPAPVQLPYTRRLLLKFLLRAIALASYAPSSGTGTRPSDSDTQKLYQCLEAMFKRSAEFGGGLFSLAANVMTDLIHHDPLCFRSIDEAGLPQAFLANIKAGALATQEAVSCIPNTLAALCLNTGGLQLVQEGKALNILLPICTSKKFLKALSSDAPAVLGAGLEELFRFVPVLRKEGIQVVVAVFRALCILGGDEEETARLTEAQVVTAVAATPAEAALAAPATADHGLAPMDSDEAVTESAPGPATAATVPSVTTVQVAPQVAADPMDTDMVDAAAGAGPAGVEPLAAASDGGVPGEIAVVLAGASMPAAVDAAGAGDGPLGDVEMTAAPPEAVVGTVEAQAREDSEDQDGAEEVSSPSEPLPLVSELASAVAAARESGMESHLAECINHATRMLEPLLQNNDTSKLFVEKGGVDLLLKLHTLPHLHPSFSFSSASHPLLAAFRTISPGHADTVSVKAKDVLAKQLEDVLPRALALRDVCVPTMAEAERDEYVRRLTATAGLIGVGSAVARNASNMLMQVSMGDTPVISKMGELERAVMQQMWVAEHWKVTQAKPQEDKTAVPDTASTPLLEPITGAPLDGLAEDSGVDADVPPLVVGDMMPDVADVEAEADGEPDAAINMDQDAVAPRPAEASSKPSKSRKKSGEEIAYDVLEQFCAMVRSFYTAVAKSIHTPARRRDDVGAQPSNPMRAAALNLALIMRANLAFTWEKSEDMPVAVSAKCQANYLLRLGQQLHTVLFDGRRRSCQSLILNYFVALSGLQSAAKRFQEAAQLMWDTMELERANILTTATTAAAPAAAGTSSEAGPSTNGSDAAMTDASASATIPAAGTVPEAKEVRVAAEQAVSWFLSVYEHLSNVSMIFQLPQAATLLVAPTPSVPGIPTREPAKDAQAFIKDLQSEILAAVVPLWAHPRLSDCSSPILNSIVNILNLCAGTSANAPSLTRQARPLNQRVQAPLDPSLVQQIVEMGFSQARAEEALRRVGVSGALRVEAATEWLFTHPEEPAGIAAPVAEPADTLDLSRAVAPSVTAITEAEAAAAEAAAAAGGPQPAEVPGAAQLVEGAVGLLQKRPTSSFAVADLLVTVAQQEEGKERAALVEQLSKSLAAGFETQAVAAGQAAGDGQGSEAGSDHAKAGQIASGGEDKVQDGKAMQIFVPVQLLLMVLQNDLPSREVAGKLGVAGQVLTMLEEWEKRYCARVESAGDVKDMDDEKKKSVFQIPVWVEALLLLLELLSNTGNKPVLRSANARQPQPPSQAPTTPALTLAAAAAPAAAAAAAAAAPDSVTDAAAPPTDVSQPVGATDSTTGTAVAAAREASGAAAEAGGTAPSSSGAGSDTVMMMEGEGGSSRPEEPALPVAAAGSGDAPVSKELQDALKSWRPCGLLTDEEQQRAVTVCLYLLRHLHAHADKWASKDTLAAEKDPSIPSPASTTQALLHLLARITCKHSIALQVHSQGGVRLLLSLPAAILSCNFTRLEPHVTAIIRHILEDHTTLKAWMEAEIKNLLTSRGRARDMYHPSRDVFGSRNPFRADMRNPFRSDAARAISVSQLLSTMSRVVSRDPYVFMEALVETCTLEVGGGSGEFLVGLKRTKDDKTAGVGTVQPDSARHVAGGRLAEANAGGAAGAAAPVTPAPPSRPSSDTRRSDEGGAARLHPPMDHTTPAQDPKHKSGVKTPRTAKKVPSTIVEVLDFLLEVLMSFKPIVEQPQPTETPGAMELDSSPTPEKPTPPSTAAAPDPNSTQPAPAAPLAASAAPSAVPVPPHPYTVEAAVANASRSSLARLLGGQLMSGTDNGRARVLAGRDPMANAAAAAASINSMTADMLKQLEAIPHAHIIQMLVLKMLTEFCLLFGSTVGFLLKRDHESAVRMGRKGSKLEHVAGGVLKQVMHHHLLALDSALLPSVAEHASQFLQAVCIRSVEGRRRIVHEIVSTLTAGFNLDMDPADRELALAPTALGKGMSLAYNALPGQPSPLKVRAFVTLVSCLVHTPSSTTPPEPRNQNQLGLSHEMIRTMREAGMVRALTQAIKLINLDNPRAPKALNSILKPLEVLTRVPLGLSKAGAVAGTAPPAPAQAGQPGTDAAGAAAGAGEERTREGANGGAAAQTIGGGEAGTGARDVRMEEPEHGYGAAAAGPDAMAMLGGGGGLDEMVMYGSGHATMVEVMEQLMEAMQDAEDGEGMDEDEDGDQELGSDDEGHEHHDEDEDEDSHGGSEEGVPIFRIELGAGDMAGMEDEDDGEESDEDDEHGVGSGSEDDDPGLTDEEEEAADHVIEGEEEELEAGADEDEEEDEDDGDEDEDEMLGHEDEDGLDEGAEINEGASEDTLLLEEYEDDDEDALFLADDAAGRRPWSRPPHLSNLLVDMDGDPFEALNRLPPPESNDFLDALDDMLAQMPGMAGGRHAMQPRSRFRVISMDQARERSANPIMQAALLPTQHRLLARPPATPGLGTTPAMYPLMPMGSTAVPDNSLVMRFDGNAWRRVNFPNLPLQNILGTQGASLLQAMVEDLTTGRGTGGYPDLMDMEMDPLLLGSGFARGEPRSPFGGQPGLNIPGGDDSGLDMRALEGPLLGHLQRLNPEVAAAAAARSAALPVEVARAAADTMVVPPPAGAVEAAVEPEAPSSLDHALQRERELLQDTDRILQDSQNLLSRTLSRVQGADQDVPPDLDAMLAQPAEAVAPAPASTSTQVPTPSAPAPGPPLPHTPLDVPASTPASNHATSVAAALTAALDAAFSQMPVPQVPTPAGADSAPVMPAPPRQLQGSSSLHAHPIQPSRAETDEGDEASPMDTEDMLRSRTVSMEDAQAASQDADGDGSPPTDQPESAPAADPSAPTAAAAEPSEPAEPAGDGSTLSPELRAAAEAAGIDITFLEALPPDLRAEVLAAATPSITASPPPIPSGEDLQLMEGLDPEVLAALPPDIQQEVLAQQRAEQRRQQAAQQQQAAAQQQQAAGELENDWTTILENSTPDVRDDLLLGANEEFLSRLPSNLVREARELRERHFRQLRDPMPPASLSRAFNMFHHSRRMHLPPDGRGPARLMPLPLPLDKPKEEVEGPPQMLDEDVMVIIQLLKVPQPILKNQLQKLLANLCGHSVTRSLVLKALLAMLHANSSAASHHASTAPDSETTIMDTEEPSSRPAAGEPAAIPASAVAGPGSASLATALDRLAMEPSAATEPPAGGLPAAGPAAATAAGQTTSQVVRRVLDALIYLSKHNQKVALLVLSLELSWADLGNQGAGPEAEDLRGKGKVAADNVAAPTAQRAVELLLNVLGQPVCQRSSGIMEQTLQLLEVALQTSNKQLQQVRDASEAAAKAAQANKEKQEKEAAEKAAKATETQTPSPVTDATAPTTEPTTATAAAAQLPPTSSTAAPTPADTSILELVAASSAALAKVQGELNTMLSSIPSPLLRQLPVLLGQEGLSELAYTRIATVVKLLVDLDPGHTPLVLDQVTTELCRVGDTVTQGLWKLQSQPGLDTDATLLSSIAVQGGMLLRMLHAVEGLSKQKNTQVKEGTTSAPVPAGTAAASASGAIGSGSAAAGSIATDGATAAGSLSGAAGLSAFVAAAAAGMGPTVGPGGAGAGGSGNGASGLGVSRSVGTSSMSGTAIQIPKVVPVIAQKLEPLWKALSATISVVEEALKTSAPDRIEASAASRILPQGATQVMPLVEAFFVLCTLQGAIPPAPTTNSREPSTALRSASSLLRAAPSDPTPPTPSLFLPPTPTPQPTPSSPHTPTPLVLPTPSATLDRIPSPQPYTAFTRFAERHKRMLNAYLRRSPNLLEGSLAPLLHVPKLIDFDNKRTFFRTKVRSEERAHHHHFSLRLSVRRDHVFEDSFHALRDKTAEQLKGKLTVSFRGEEGIDAGGVSREWYQVMAREIFNPNTALFVQVPEGGTTFQPNPNSVVQTERHYDHLDFFRFVGKLVGKAMYDGQLMDAYFTRSFYKHMLGMPITYEDIEAVDPAYFKTLKWMLENDITDVLDLTFTAETDFFGKKEIVELKAGGKDMRVTEENKLEYVNLIARHHMTTAIRSQIEAFLQGFWDLIPPKLISIFNDHELELLISGLPDIDVDDMRANTEYTGFTAATPVIQWFWEVVREMDKQDLALLLQFVTGTSKVPLEGFKALQGISGPQKFQIHKAYVASNRLPSAHTCFNQLDLPEYESKEQFVERLMVAIHEGSEGFGFG